MAEGAGGEAAEPEAPGVVPLMPAPPEGEGIEPVPDAAVPAGAGAETSGIEGIEGTAADEAGAVPMGTETSEVGAAEVKVLVRVQGQLLMVRVVAVVTVKVELPSTRVVAAGQKVV